MSKQYYVTKAITNAHKTDVFSVAVTPTAVLSGSGGSTLFVHSTTAPAYSTLQAIDNAHKLGCHHVTTSKAGPGRVACSAGFCGEIRVWQCNEAGDWGLDTVLRPDDLGESVDDGGEGGHGDDGGRVGRGAKSKRGDAWALALSTDEQYLAYTTHNGSTGIWDLAQGRRLLVYSAQSKATGSFCMAVDISQDGRYTAAGNQSGTVNVFDNNTSKLLFSLPGLAKPVRAVAFSPLGKRLATGGDAGVIALYEMKHGEHVGSFTAPGSGSAAWVMALDFSASGEYLLSGYMDGKVRIWNTDKGTCMTTYGESDMTAIWSVKWLRPSSSEKPGSDTEAFCTAGADHKLTFYREAGSNPVI